MYSIECGNCHLAIMLIWFGIIAVGYSVFISYVNTN